MVERLEVEGFLFILYPRSYILSHALAHKCTYNTSVSVYEKVSDVSESRVWFASKNLRPRKMH